MRSYNLQQRKYKIQQARRTRQIFERILLTICIIALLAIGGSAMLTKATTQDESNDVYYKYFKQIEIEAGDTLWDIAGEYMENGPYQSRKEYMEEVASINQLKSTTIKAGQHLLIPYYDSEFK
jgi:cell division protein YceG involved in septum cleavage